MTNPTNEMIEKCARAISGAPFPGTASRRKARAVLKELMTPTDEMVEAGELVAVRDFIPAGQYIPLVWQAMLEQALEGEGE